MHLKMVESESTFAYMEATREYIEHHGKPVAFYSDKHSVFRNNTASAKGDGMTHFGRALEALAIEIICAHSPQAKGRVERANGTCQRAPNFSQMWAPKIPYVGFERTDYLEDALRRRRALQRSCCPARPWAASLAAMSCSRWKYA